MDYNFIDPEKITDMLYGDAKYVIDFCEAGVTSFEEFNEKFRLHLMERNMEDLRKAGHKIKPGAQMMGAHEIVEEYENAKKLITDDADNDDLKKSADKMQQMCKTIQNELTQLANNQN